MNFKIGIFQYGRQYEIMFNQYADSIGALAISGNFYCNLNYMNYNNVLKLELI